MGKSETSCANQIHQYLVTVSQHFYISKKGILSYQEKPFDIKINNYQNSKREHLVYYVLIDNFSGNFIFQVTTTRQLFPLADFLYYAWRNDKNEDHFWGIPDSISIPKTISSPALFQGLESLGLKPFNPSRGFSSGGHVIRALEEHLWSQILYRSTLHFSASIEMHKANLYDLILGLSVHGDSRTKWRNNLPAGQPKAIPPYEDFIKLFNTPEERNEKLPLTYNEKFKNLAESIPPSSELPHYFTTPLQNLVFSEGKLEEANLINNEAWEEGDTIKGLKAAYHALEHSPFCADALNYLSLYSKYDEEKCLLSQRAEMVGKAALGDLFIKKNEGHFWMILETRPYMRALLGLADCCQRQQNYEEAIELYQRMLKLNPSDNQGVRYALGNLLLLLDHREELEQYFIAHGREESCFILYNKALHQFRIASDRAEETINKAIASNKHVYSYLSGEKYIPYHLPEHYSWGEPSEAICYAAETQKAWENTPGAIGWLKKNMVAYEKKAQIANDNATIEQLLNTFLFEQSKRLAKSTYNKYETVIGLLIACIESYEYNYLSLDEKNLFDQYYSSHRDEEDVFCKLFGPDKIASSAVEYLSYFLPHKVSCGKDLQKTSAAVIKKLGQWLFNKGYIDQTDFEIITDEAVIAGQQLPAIVDFEEALYSYISEIDFKQDWTEEEELDDVFEVIAVKPGILTLETYTAGKKFEVDVKVPQKISKLCKVGWTLNLLLVKTNKGWIIIDAGKVSY